MDESQTTLCSLLAAPGNPWSRLDSKSGHFCNWQWQLTQDAHGKVYKLWHFTNPPPSSLSSADACLADELKNMWSRGCLPDGRRHLPHLLLWAWYQKSFQACKHQEGSRSRWYQWGSSQTLCWPTSASLHKDINLSLAQSVIPTCFKRSTKTGLPDHYRPVELTLTGKSALSFWVKDYICCRLDPQRFAYHPNRSTEDAEDISSTLPYPTWTSKRAMWDFWHSCGEPDHWKQWKGISEESTTDTKTTTPSWTFARIRRW